MKNKKPDLVFLMETKLMSSRASFLKSILGFDSMFVVDSKGRSGVLILLWDSEWQISNQNYNRRHINASIQMGVSGTIWKFTGFYGHPEVAKCPEAWALLRCLSQMSPTSWLCIGDFNEIISGAETTSKAVQPCG